MIGCITAEGIAASNAAALKAYTDRGIDCGPGQPMPPELPEEPQAYDRPYITAGHAADSPGNEPRTLAVRLDWRAGVHGEGPGAAQVRNWRPGVVSLPPVPGEGSR